MSWIYAQHDAVIYPWLHCSGCSDGNDYHCRLLATATQQLPSINLISQISVQSARRLLLFLHSWHRAPPPADARSGVRLIKRLTRLLLPQHSLLNFFSAASCAPWVARYALGTIARLLARAIRLHLPLCGSGATPPARGSAQVSGQQ